MSHGGSDLALGLLLASPWIIPPAVTMWRVRRSRHLESYSPAVPSPAPIVSVIVPARNERHNIEACIRSVVGGSYSNVELIIVDDRSTDGTREAARAAAGDDPRVRILENPDLPDGWFGKPWACATGARQARGEILCFTDADARHGPHLVTRAVNAMTAGTLDMLSVVGHQELSSFWERIVQPHVFWMLGSRYGGTEAVNRSSRVRDKIANGQCIFIRRDAYDVLGGHGAVRHEVAEDMALAQTLFAAGKRTEVILGTEELSTRMYTSLSEIMAGWRKNVFAGGRDAMPWGRLGQVIFPVILVLAPLLTLLPPAALAACVVTGNAPSWLFTAATIAVGAQLGTWVVVYAWMRAGVPYALLYPLGAAVVGLIVVQAISRGSRVEWKGRAYLTSRRAPHTSR